MSRRVLYLDCAGGAAGDMLLCALAEAADCVSSIEELPDRLGFADVSLRWPQGRPGGFSARRLDVRFDPDVHPRHRNLADVVELIESAGVPPNVVTRAASVGSPIGYQLG